MTCSEDTYVLYIFNQRFELNVNLRIGYVRSGKLKISNAVIFPDLHACVSWDNITFLLFFYQFKLDVWRLHDAMQYHLFTHINVWLFYHANGPKQKNRFQYR